MSTTEDPVSVWEPPASTWLGNTHDEKFGFHGMDTKVDELLMEQSGVSLPAAPTHGQRYFQTAYGEWFTYSEPDGCWLGDSRIFVRSVHGGSCSGWLKMGESSLWGFSSDLGWTYGYGLRVKEIHGYALAQSTCTWSVTVDGSVLTGASIDLVTAQKASNSEIVAPTIPADAVIGLKVNSGTADTGSVVTAVLRRYSMVK